MFFTLIVTASVVNKWRLIKHGAEEFTLTKEPSSASVDCFPNEHLQCLKIHEILKKFYGIVKI